MICVQVSVTAVLTLAALVELSNLFAKAQIQNILNLESSYNLNYMPQS
jgi:hypothetical protein